MRNFINKQDLIDSRKDIKEDINGLKKDITALGKAISIKNKLDSGEKVSDKEKEEFKNIKDEYQQFFQEKDLTSMAGLQQSIHHFRQERQSFVDIKDELDEQIKEASKLEEGEDSDETIKPHKNSKDFKQDSSDITSDGELMDFNDPDG